MTSPDFSISNIVRSSAASLGIAAGGAAVLGGLISLQNGALAAARSSATMPAIFIGLAVVMVPALYILSAQLGWGPRARVFVDATAAALRSAGWVMLGLALPAAFLISTQQSSVATQLVGIGVLAAASVAAIGVFYVHLFDTGEWTRGAGVFVLWALVTLVCGARLFFSMLAA